MTDQVISVDCITVNMSPDAFHLWAQHYYKCKQDFQNPDRFSPVPYFLLCRAIELEIKSRHLQNMKQEEVKHGFGHNLRFLAELLHEEGPSSVMKATFPIAGISTSARPVNGDNRPTVAV